jgi:nucleoid-associated protein EbfC
MTDNSDTPPEVPEVVDGPGLPGPGIAGPGPGDTGGLGDLGGLLESAQQAFSAQAEAAQQVVEGSAGGGVVTVRMTGNGEVTAVTLAPEVVDPDDIDMLQDLIVAALRDAGLKVTDLQREALGALGDIGIGGLGDMFGAPDAGPEGPGGSTGPGENR